MDGSIESLNRPAFSNTDGLTRPHNVHTPPPTTAVPLIRNPGMFHYRDGGEEHLNSPMSMVALQQVRAGPRALLGGGGGLVGQRGRAYRSSRTDPF